MKKLHKWDYDKRKYVDYEVPDDWRLAIYEVDMDTLCNCCQCGKEIPYGESYTSQEVHTPGLGYAVCEACHEKEMKILEAYES